MGIAIMDQTGFNKSKFGPDLHGFNHLKALHWNHRPSALYQMSLERGEGEIADGGGDITIVFPDVETSDVLLVVVSTCVA